MVAARLLARERVRALLERRHAEAQARAALTAIVLDEGASVADRLTASEALAEACGDFRDGTFRRSPITAPTDASEAGRRS